MRPIVQFSRAVVACAAALLLFAAAPFAGAQPQYEAIDLGTLGGSTSTANGISENGIIAGSATNAMSVKHAVLWDSAGIVDLGVPPGFTVGEAVAANDAGQAAVIGSSSPQSYGAFLWEDGVWTELPPLPGQPESLPEDINSAGQVAGRSFTLGAGDERAVLWDHGTMTELGTLEGLGGLTIAFGINDAGQIVGYSDTNPDGGALERAFRAFLWQDGVMADLGILPGEDQAAAFDVNDLGDVAGYSYHLSIPLFLQVEQATLWRDGGDQIIDLGPTPAGLPGPCALEFPFLTTNRARGVNNCGQVVGAASCVGSGGPRAAFLWQDGVNYNLNDLIRAGSGLELVSAADINDAGQIVGIGVNAAGRLRGFLLEPLTPPPCDELPGDLDGDGDVDLSDLARLLAAFNTCAGDAGYDPVADIDGSGCVDLADLATLLANFGV